MVQRLREILDSRHDYAQRWKERTGGKVVGYFCSYTPEEVLYAAGILPIRIVGGLEPADLAETHIHGMYCPFCRDCLNQGLKGIYDYLDGIVMAQSCMHIRQAFDSWRMHLPISYSYYIYMPVMVDRPSARVNFIKGLAKFKRSLEDWTGSTISEEALDRAIDVYNTNRRLMRQIYELRRSAAPPLSGAEAMEMVLSSMFSDKEEHNLLLAELLKELPNRGDRPKQGARLIILGGESHNPEVLRLIEEAGANVVIDDLCMGSRYFWNEVVTAEDPLSAIATRYLTKPRCPIKDGSSRSRFEHILNLTREYDVQGAFLVQQKFCDPHEFDIPALEQLLRQNSIPNYFIELDVTIPKGQIKTRAEAFLEMLEVELF